MLFFLKKYGKILLFLHLFSTPLVMGNSEAQPPEGSKTPNNEPKTVSDCQKYREDWRVAQCASSLKRQKLITKHMFNTLLNEAIKMERVGTTTYYSMGLISKPSISLVAAKQIDPVFESELSIPLDPRNLYHDTMYYDNVAPVDKPVLIYLSERVDDIPQLKEGYLSMLHPKGNKDSGLRVYRYGPIEVDTSPVEACSKFGSWDYLASAKKMVGVAIVMPTSMWCPETAKDSFVVMHGTYAVGEMGSLKQKYLIPISQDSQASEHRLNAPENSVF